MTRFGPPDGGTISRARLGGVPRSPGPPALNTPRQPFVEYSPGNSAPGSLLRVIDSAGTVIGGLADFAQSTAALATQEARAVEARRRDREKLEADAELYDRGMAARDAGELLPTIRDQIAKGSLLPGEGDDRQTAVDYIESISEGHSEAYRSELRERLAPSIVQSRLERRNKILHEQTKANDALLAHAAAGTEGRTAQIVARYRASHPDATHEAVQAELLVPALRLAARAGNADRVKDLAGRIDPNLFSAEIAEANLAIEESGRRAQRIADDELDQAASGAWVGFHDGVTSLAGVEEAIRARKGRASPEAIDRQLGRVRAARESIERDSRRAAADLAELKERDRIGTAAESAFLKGELWSTDDAEFERPDGRVVRVPRKEIVEAAVQRGFDAIDQRQKDPEKAIAEKIYLLGRNGVGYAPWERLLAAGYSGASMADAGGKLPESVSSAIDLDARIDAISPTVRDAMVPERAARFYDAVRLAEKYGAAPDRPSAVAAALRAANTPTTENVDRAAALKAAKLDHDPPGPGNSRSFGEVKNAGELAVAIQSLASFYIRAAGVPPEEAVTLAADRVKSRSVIVNGYAVHAPGSPPGLSEAAPRLIKGAIDKDEDPDDYALVPHPGGQGAFVLFNQARGVFAPAVFTARQIEEAEAARKAEIRQGILKPKVVPRTLIEEQEMGGGV